MKSTAKISFLLLSSKIKRTISFICLIALLSVTAGLLGNNILNRKDTLDPVRIAVVDLEESVLSDLMFSTLISSVDGRGLLDITKTSEDSAKIMMENGELTAVFVISDDFFEGVLSGENRPIIASYNPYTPLQSSLTKMYVEQILEILKASQAGIYTTMDYTRENFPEKASDMHNAINLRYINAAMAHNKIIKAEEVSASLKVDSFTYYMFSTLVFLLMIGCCLYCFIIGENFPTSVLAKLKQQKSSFSIAGGWIVGWWGWYGILAVVIAAAYGIFAGNIGMPFSLSLLPAMLFAALCFSALGVFLGFIFYNPVYSTVVLSVYCVLSVFFSGGIIPLNYMPPIVTAIGKLFPGYWAMESIQYGLLGGFSILANGVLLLFTVIFWILTSVYIRFSKREAAL